MIWTVAISLLGLMALSIPVGIVLFLLGIGVGQLVLGGGLALPADHWWQDPALAARNADLLEQGRLLGQRLRAAEAELVAAIVRAARWGSVDATPDATADDARGDATQPESPDTPWGPPADRGESCGKSVFDLPGRFAAGVGDALWDALGGVGELLSGYDFHHWPPPGWTVLDDVAAGDMPAAGERLGHWLKIGRAHV